MSFLIPCGLLTTLWIILHLAPFGNNNLLISDLGTQYMPFLSLLKHLYQGNFLSTYSFFNGLGNSILALSAYYLSSPFNFITMLFSYDQLPLAVLLIITLKISLMGTSMMYYLTKTYRSMTYFTLLFSTSYSFCGFVTIYSLNFMWLDALILLPLITLGIQILWDSKRYWLYSFSLTAAIITNYYMGYMLCIFSVCYSVYWYFKQVHVEKGTQLLKKFLLNSRLFIVSSFLSGISTCFVLLPTLEEMLQTKKTEFNLSSFAFIPKFNLAFFSQFGLGTLDYAIRLNHLPSIFSGLLMTLLCFAYFFVPNETKKEKWAAFLLILTLFISFWLQNMNTIWHMFQLPAGFPYRNSFIFSFLVISFAYKGFLKMQKEKKISIKAPILITLLLIVGIWSLLYENRLEFVLSYHFLWISILFIWCFYFLINLLFMTPKKNYKHSIEIILLFFFVFLELGGNFWIAFKNTPYGDQALFSKTYKTQQKLIQQTFKEDPSLFRLKQTLNTKKTGFREINNGYNDPLLYNYAGISSYSSTLNANTQSSLTDLGLYSKNGRRITYVDNSQVVNLLFNVKNQFSFKKEQRRIKPMLQDNIYIYKNPEAIGMGFLVDPNFKKLNLISKQPLLNQEHVLQSIKEIDEPYFPSAKIVKVNKQTKNHIKLSIRTTTTGDLHLYIPNFSWDNMKKMKVNGKKITHPIAIHTNQLENLGYYKENTPIQLEFITNQPIDLDTLELKTLDQQAFDTLVSSLKEQSLKLIRQRGSNYEGTLQVKGKKKQLLYVSIPYNQNWQVFIDGKPVKAQKILNNFIGINVKGGKHTITFGYQPKSFYYGVTVIITVFVGILYYQLAKRRKNNQQRR